MLCGLKRSCASTATRLRHGRSAASASMTSRCRLRRRSRSSLSSTTRRNSDSTSRLTTVASSMRMRYGLWNRRRSASLLRPRSIARSISAVPIAKVTAASLAHGMAASESSTHARTRVPLIEAILPDLAPEPLRRVLSVADSPALNNVYEEQHDGDDQQDVEQAADRIGGDHTEQPQRDQQNNQEQHVRYPGLDRVAQPLPRGGSSAMVSFKVPDTERSDHRR